MKPSRKHVALAKMPTGTMYLDARGNASYGCIPAVNLCDTLTEAKQRIRARDALYSQGMPYAEQFVIRSYDPSLHK